MNYKLLEKKEDRTAGKTYVVVFDKRDEFISIMQEFAREQNISAAHFTAIGAFEDVTLGYFDRDKMDYKKIPIHEQVELLSMVGNITLSEGGRKIHAHAVVGRSDGTTRGGHILEAYIWPTLEMFLVETPSLLQRTTDQETGLVLIDLQR